MRPLMPALASALAMTILPVSAQRTADAGDPLTLAEAMALAEVASPAVRVLEAQRAAAEGFRREADAPLFNNPELSVERGRRRTPRPDAAATEWGAAIAQPFETGGQQSRRREAASAQLRALAAELEAARRQARAEAASRFHAVLAAQRRVQLEQRFVGLFERSAQAVEKRRAAGEDTRLDANVALVEAERARNALALANEQLLDARGELASALQRPGGAMPRVEGDLPASIDEAPPYRLEQLLDAAQALPRHRALAAREDAARARLGVESAARNPDVTVGVGVAREGAGDARERIATLSLSVPLPLYQRNHAGVGQALAAVAHAEVERAAALRGAQAQVRRLWTKLQSQRERAQRLQRALLPVSAANRQLAEKSREAGQIGLLDQLLVNRQVLDVERELNDALADYLATRIELEHAAGWPPEGTAR